MEPAIEAMEEESATAAEMKQECQLRTVKFLADFHGVHPG